MATSHSLQEGSQCGLEDHTGKQKVTPSSERGWLNGPHQVEPEATA